MSYAPPPPEKDLTMVILVIVGGMVAFGFLASMFSRLLQITFQ